MDQQLYRSAERIASEPPATSTWRSDLYTWATERPADETLVRAMRYGFMVVAALLLGAGLIFWIAANWQALSSGARLGLIEVALLGAMTAAYLMPRGRIAALFCAQLILGGLLAFIGQTYQTGADAWQLFAGWALLSLIWVVTARSELLWTVWMIIAALALALWTGPLGIMGVFSFERSPGLVSTALTMITWLFLGLIPTLVNSVPWLATRQAPERWSHRVALGMTLAAWTYQAVASLFVTEGFSQAWLLAAFLVTTVTWLSLRGRCRDLLTHACGLLAANVLLMALATRWLLRIVSDVSGLLLLGLLGMVCLGASATWLLRQQKAFGRGEQG